MALLAVAAHAAAAGVINSVETKRVGEGIVISVNGTGLTAPKEERAWRNQTYILSFDAKMMARASRSAVNFGGVEYVQWTQFTVRPMVSRVVLRLRPTDQPVLKETSTGWNISVNVSGETAPDATGTVNGGTATRTTTDNIELHPTTRPANGDTIPRVVASGVVTPSSGAVLLGNSGVAADKRVSLNFESTEVVLILKALAAQAGVNIVTSPDVKGAISVQFDNVTVDHALQVITAISGLRYQRLENTIIVAPSDKLMQIIANVTAGSGGAVGPSQTRIVPIFSHQGRQIKAALYRVMPQDGSVGRYDLVLQSEQTMPNPLTGESGAVNPGGAPAGSPAPPTSPTTTSNDTTDEYIMIIGTPKRLDEVENMIHEVDTQLCNALGVEIPSTLGTVQETYTVKGATAAKLLEALGVKDGKLNGVALVATPVSSSSPQNIVVSGKANDVRRVLAMLGEMDAPPAVNEGYEVYEVSFMDPRGLRDELMQQIPGLRVSVPPAGAGATRLYQPVTYSNTGGNGGSGNGGATNGGSANGGASGGSSGGGGGDENGKVGGSSGLKSGLSQPFSGLEPVAVPMRLVLRGSREAITRAYDLLKKLDVAPAQCALELRVMQLSKEDAISAGIDWNLFTGGAVKFLRLNNSVPDLHNSGGVSINDRNFSGDVVAALDKVANSSNLISRPNLVAYDGRETEIFIGDVIRYVESITSSQNGPSVQIGEVRVGVNLAVLARVSADGTATLDLRPTVSSLKGFTKVSVQGFAADLPQTTETVSQNTVAVKDGETIAIGGLITDEVTKRATGVPILMDLPILGNLFRSTVTGRNRRELVIFVTTRKINGPLGAETTTIPMRDGQNPPAGNP